MSVYTSIDKPQLEAFLLDYPVEKLIEFKGIEAGITNSNFFVTTQNREYVLTIVEHETASDVEWFMQLLGFLHQSHIPCAEPIIANTNQYTQILADKPATLVAKLIGHEKVSVHADDCYEIGSVLAKLHVSCKDYPSQRSDSRGQPWHQQTTDKVSSRLSKEDKRLLTSKMNEGYIDKLNTLPGSVIHADLFRDNVLFDKGRISGIIDFYYACSDCMLYDLAIVFNDWCRCDDKTIDTLRARALFNGYEKIRTLQSTEKAAWPQAVQRAALRFWLSRLHDWHFPIDGLLTSAHDPAPLKSILNERTPAIGDLTT